MTLAWYDEYAHLLLDLYSNTLLHYIRAFLYSGDQGIKMGEEEYAACMLFVCVCNDAP